MLLTRRSTLLDSSSFFSLLMQEFPDTQELFVDRDPTHFRHVLNWMRGVRFLPDDDNVLQELSWEAEYFSMTTLRDAIVRTKQRYNVARSLASIHNDIRNNKLPLKVTDAVKSSSK